MFAAQGNALLQVAASWLAAGTIAWSLFWLLVVPNNPRFRRSVDAKLKAAHENDFDYQYLELGGRIALDYRHHADSMRALRNRARSILEEKFGTHDIFARDNLDKLDRLAISYLQLLAALTEYQEYVDLVDPQGHRARDRGGDPVRARPPTR